MMNEESVFSTPPEEIAIHGGGYVGLTAAVHYALKGIKVTIYDPDPSTVESINSGHPRAGEFLEYLDVKVERLINEGLLRATVNFFDIQKFKVHSVAVPSEKGGEPYDVIVRSVILKLVEVTPQETLIIIESTLTPGLMDEILEEIKKTKKMVGRDVFIAVCPRIDWFADEGKSLENLSRPIGGVTTICTRKAMAVVGVVSSHLMMTDYKSAEWCKVFQNAQLHLQITLAQQFAYACPDINTAEVLRLAGTHWRLTPLHLGFGVGGRCVPLGTKYLLQGVTHNVLLAEEVDYWHKRFPVVIATCVICNVKKGGKVVVMGIGYRPDFKDSGLSPGLMVAKHLEAEGFEVAVWDPLWTKEELIDLTGLAVRPPSTEEDAILLATPHTSFIPLPLDFSLWRKGQFVLDGSGEWRKYRDILKSNGVKYIQIGEPRWLKGDVL